MGPSRYVRHVMSMLEDLIMDEAHFLTRTGGGDSRCAGRSTTAYPAGGWDNRTSCPRFFDQFPGGVIKRHPNETLPRARSLPRHLKPSRSPSPVSPRSTLDDGTQQRFKELLKEAQNAVFRATGDVEPSKQKVTEVSAEEVPTEVRATE
mmetsp:Transcript_12931/g.15656  ORF Transcript_12931/g.15656 Transcript_12931/m.15656 type:complete len:149 (+) Transcript_12931:241-687(+)